MIRSTAATSAWARPTCTFLATALTVAISATGIALANSTSTQSGAYTAAQADRGKLVYEKSCVNCHQVDFYRERLPRYENRTAGALFEAVSTTMPADNVGSLLTSEYIDVIAYIFSITGSPAGATELSTDNMDAVQISPVN